jgi:hypothetical protein
MRGITEGEKRRIKKFFLMLIPFVSLVLFWR